MMNRRQFLGFGIASIGLTSLGVSNSYAKHTPLLYSASNNAKGQHQISSLNLATNTRQDWTIPFRAHDVLPLPDKQQIIAFGRRPENQCAVATIGSSDVTLIQAQTGRHFYGHGCLSADKSVLFTTENDYDAVRGTIGIRDAQSHQIVGEYETYGVGPHDIHLMPDQKTLVVANGGIQTHPDFGRRKLNLDTMQPSLVYIDSETGKKLDEYRLDDHQLSIRHLTVTQNGDVGIATQYQGKLYKKQPNTLVAWQKSGDSLQSLAIDAQQIKPCKGYMADLAFDMKPNLLAVTSPRGNRVTFWNTEEKQFLYDIELPEPSGIVFQAETKHFLVSSANGNIYQLNTNRHNKQVKLAHQTDHIIWDNHMFMV